MELFHRFDTEGKKQSNFLSIIHGKRPREDQKLIFKIETDFASSSLNHLSEKAQIHCICEKASKRVCEHPVYTIKDQNLRFTMQFFSKSVDQSHLAMERLE